MITNEISNLKTKEKELLVLVQSLEKDKHDLNLIKINEFNTLNEDLTSNIDIIKKEIVAFKLDINSLQKYVEGLTGIEDFE